jgi:beta-glucosidase
MADKQTSKQNITVKVDVENIGKYKGDEVVQLYIKDEVSSVTVYETQLRGFERTALNVGEKKTIEFTIKPDD